VGCRAILDLGLWQDFDNGANYNKTVVLFSSARIISRFSDILLLGHDWAEDQERLISLLTILESEGEIDSNSKPRIGVIGSRSKWQSFESECLNAGISQQSLNGIQCPIGLSIGAETPEEIAIAVIAQILSTHKGVDHSQPTWRSSQ